MESSINSNATTDSLKELWHSFEQACMESLTEPPTDIVDRVAATLEDAISWLRSHSPQVFLPRHRGPGICQAPKVSSSQLPSSSEVMSLPRDWYAKHHLKTFSLSKLQKEIVSTSAGSHLLPAGSPLTRPSTDSMDGIDPPLREDLIWSRLHQSEKVSLKRDNNQGPLETGGGSAPRENAHIFQACRRSIQVLTPSITDNPGSPDTRNGTVPLTIGTSDAAGEAYESHAHCHSSGSPMLAEPNAGRVCSTGVEPPGRSPRNAACNVQQPEDQERGQRAGRPFLREEINDPDDGGVEEEEELGTRSANGRKRTCTNRTFHSPQKTAKMEHTPEGLAERFGTNDRGALISTLREEWEDITSSQLLSDTDTTAPIGMSQSPDVPSFVNFILQQGRQLETNSLRGEVRSLKNRIDFAHYYQLYVAASNDTRKGADSPFLAWMREWYRRRNRSQSLVMSRGKGASTVVKDCLVDLHLSDSRFKGVSPRSMRRRVEKWRAIGGFWSKLIEGFGPGMLLLAPSCEPDSR
ncbi:hypothetical protein PV08_12028 [Exophiala spinifera]|uniref:Uncharacterized protein n=1 Tax=Exophiala spinifera TaxID=91928 RepID=A0A0D2BEC0_9EURO|nr:uncharacterized protein PV08_12028 [Exophiala spinifera]KIW09744.1 hypothetical protein PV08_12028 [Exophiala spinifera]